MTEGSRGPEGSSGPARTDRGNAAGSDDFYAAAAAAVAARNGAGNRRAAATAQDRDKLMPQARPAEKPAQNQPAVRTNQPSSPSSGNKAADADSDSGPTTTVGSIASSVLNAVRPKSRSERAAERAANDGPAADLVRTSPPAPVQSAPVQSAPVQAAPAAAAPAEPLRSQKPRPGVARGTRKARLRLSRLDPWSVMKTSFLFSIAAGIVFVVAVFAVWTVIGSSGLFSSIDSIVGSVLQSPGDSTPFRIENYVNTQKVMGVTAFLACIDVVNITALATLASFLYNLAATMLGGLEVTLAED